MQRLRTSVLLLSSVLLSAGPALAASPEFAPVPAPAAGAKASAVKLRVVGYTGSTNGEMIVEVLNDGAGPAAFDPAGLYFVPKGDPESAPQRLGATGPFEVAAGDGWKDTKALTLGAKEKKQLKLQVFCIDSHRSSPSPSTPFALATERMPTTLRAEVEQGTQAILSAKKVGNAKHAKGEVQSHMWKTRDKNWIRLQGERSQEKSSGSNVQQQRNVLDEVQIQRRAP